MTPAAPQLALEASTAARRPATATAEPTAPARAPVASQRRRFARFRRRRHPVSPGPAGARAGRAGLHRLVGYSVGGYLTRPGNDSVSQRVAEWGRDHHLGSLVTWLEQVQYPQNKPKKGGTIKGGGRRALKGDDADP